VAQHRRALVRQRRSEQVHTADTEVRPPGASRSRAVRSVPAMLLDRAHDRAPARTTAAGVDAAGGGDDHTAVSTHRLDVAVVVYEAEAAPIGRAPAVHDLGDEQVGHSDDENAMRSGTSCDGTARGLSARPLTAPPRAVRGAAPSSTEPRSLSPGADSTASG